MTLQPRTPRHRVLKGGRIVFNRRTSVIDCTVRNLSAGGAHLHVGDILGVPDHFTLFIDLDKTEKECEVVWRRERQLGIRFV
jgi:hypothetical protein